MNLITQTELENYMRGIGSPVSDVDPLWVRDRIAAWSRVMARYCGRLDWGTNGSTVTEYYDGGSRHLQLHQIPNVSVIDICEDANWGWGTGTARDSSGYDADADYGVVTLGEGGQWLSGPRAVRVRYTAGYTSTSDVPDDLKEACLTQVCHAWRQMRTRRTDEDMSPVTGSLTRAVREMIGSYRIVSV